MTLRLIIGNKNYSSWSMRPWIAMKALGIPFEETLIPLYLPDSGRHVLAASPTGKLPVLIDSQEGRDIQVWESLAILEYLAETLPQSGLWPAERAARAHARAIANEMHAGFLPLRRACPMNFRRAPKPIPLDAEVQANIDRIVGLWEECRGRYGGDGDFLFGSFTIADAMFAPVVSRFHTYAVAVGAVAQAYMEAVMALPAWQEWTAAARAEPWLVAAYERD